MKIDALYARCTAHLTGLGAAFWLLFAIVAVAVRGVRWDEDYEFAQVILGQVTFPEGHPLYQYVHSFFSLQPYSLAGLMYFLPDPMPANALRNFLFMAASTVPVYLLAAEITRRPLLGHCAVLFVLLEVHVPFYSSYPIHVWPGIFSNGPIGFGYMILTLWAMVADRYRTAGLLLGFAPLMHLGQFPPLLATATLYVTWNLFQRRFAEMKHLFTAAAPGLLTMVLFGLYLKTTAMPPPTEGPYFTEGDPMAFWREFMAVYATHRAIPYTTGHLVLLGALIMGATMWWLRDRKSPLPAFNRDSSPNNPLVWIGVYLAITLITVWGIMAIHYVLGSNIPYLLAGWLPYRLMNHVGPLLIVLLLAAGYRRDQSIPLWLPVLLLIGIMTPLLHLALPGDTVARYVGDRAYLFFLLYGAGGGAALMQARPIGSRHFFVLAAALLVAWCGLAWVHQFGAACVVLGGIVGALPRWPRLAPRRVAFATGCTLTVCVLALLAQQGERRQHLPTQHFLVAVSSYLADQGEEDAMLLVPHQQEGMQMQLGHPVMADMATLFHGIYRPPIAPAVNAVYRDFYGIYLDPDDPAPDRDLPWYEVWPAKSREEWQRLSKKYTLHYVIAPRFMDLPLQPLFRDSQFQLYRIPDEPPAQ